MPVSTPNAKATHGYQLGVAQDVLLALLGGGGAHGYELRARLQLALGPLSAAMNAGQVYVTLHRLEKAGWIRTDDVQSVDGRDRKVYVLTARGQERVAAWLDDTSWPKPAPAEFHLKLVAAAAAGLRDPVGLIDRQRRVLLGELATAQRTALVEPTGSVASLLHEGVILRLEADLRWLDACAQFWLSSKGD